MIAEAFQYIARLVEDSLDAKVVEIHGAKYRGGKRILPATPSPLVVSFLEGVARMAETEWDVSETLVFIQSPTVVELVSTIGDYDEMQRHFFGSANCAQLVKAYEYGNWMELEDAIVRLQSRFVETEERDALIRLLGNIEDSVVKSATDDGISQTVTVKKGIASRSSEVVPRSVRLRPYRTFPEVEQPESPFTVRLKQRSDGLPSVALFDADGGAWQVEAISNIRAWFEKRLPDLAVIG